MAELSKPMMHTRLLTSTLLMLAVVASPHVGAQSRLAVKLSDYSPNGRTSLFRLPSQALEWTAPERLLNGVFTGTGRYFVGVKEVSRAPLLLQIWVGEVMTGAIWTSDAPGYNGAFVTANPRKDEVYI